jgi:hypothetical protein
MKYSEITGFICTSKSCTAAGLSRWRDGRKCKDCGRKVQPGDMCRGEYDTGFGTATLYDTYRPPRPLTMTPAAYQRKYGCVDANWKRVTNGRYYCQPAHCNRSWKSKKKRDEHLKIAYGALM